MFSSLLSFTNSIPPNWNTMEKGYIEGNPGIDSIIFFHNLVCLTQAMQNMSHWDNCFTKLTLAILYVFPEPKGKDRKSVGGCLWRMARWTPDFPLYIPRRWKLACSPIQNTDTVQRLHSNRSDAELYVCFIYLFKVKVVLVCEGSGGEDSIFSSPIIESTLEQQSAGLVNSNSVRSIRWVKI